MRRKPKLMWSGIALRRGYNAYYRAGGQSGLLSCSVVRECGLKRSHQWLRTRSVNHPFDCDFTCSMLYSRDVVLNH